MKRCLSRSTRKRGKEGRNVFIEDHKNEQHKRRMPRKCAQFTHRKYYFKKSLNDLCKCTYVYFTSPYSILRGGQKQ